MRAILSLLFATSALAEQIRPGVFKYPLKKVHKDFDFHPELKSDHPVVGNWTESEMWMSEVKQPVHSLNNYLYTMDCLIGTPPQHFQCIFDTSTSISSTFNSTFSESWVDYTDRFFDDTASSSFLNSGTTIKFDSIGLNFDGWSDTDEFCIGDGDVHITVLSLIHISSPRDRG